MNNQLRILPKLYCIVLCLACLPVMLAGQGFNTVNDRNHPYLKWQVSETEHFEIIFPLELAGIDTQAAAIAEETYRVLLENLGVTPENKIRLYLADMDEISNGFAVMAGRGYATIWVHVNDYATIWTGDEKWLRKVIAHELTHLFHYHATKTNIGLLNYIVADPVPRFWSEGLAQYQTEEWDSQRGDRWLRKAIFDSRPDYRDNQSYYNSRLLYASGSSQVRYFAEAYGDSLLRDLLSYRKRIGLYEIYDAYDAFQQVTGQSYSSFYEEWRKHINVYYNTLATQMSRVDSLSVPPEKLPGDFIFDMRYSPDRKTIAILNQESVERPIRQLHLVENDSARSSKRVISGSINEDLNWHPDSHLLVYSRIARTRHGSLVNDLFLLDTETGKEYRMTNGRRASYPVFSRDGSYLAYIVNEGGTGNIIIRSLAGSGNPAAGMVSGRSVQEAFENSDEQRLTHYESDSQLVHLEWDLNANRLMAHLFDSDGDRHLISIDPVNGESEILDDSSIDNRHPVMGPEGRILAYTSLRDDVPNVFMMDLETGLEWRVTHLFTGGELLDWLPSAGEPGWGRLVVKASETKLRDDIYLIDASTRLEPGTVSVSNEYTTWKQQRPPELLPTRITPSSELITGRYRYRPWQNISHLSTILLPFYLGNENWGIAGYTSWFEPLGKHLIFASGSVSLANPRESFGRLSYVNNQFTPTINLNLYRSPGSARFYGSNFVVEEFTGGDLSFAWPLNVRNQAYRNSTIGLKFQLASVTPKSLGAYKSPSSIPQPNSGDKLKAEFWWELKHQSPYRHNRIHPLDGYGVRITTTGSARDFESSQTSFTADVNAYTIWQGLTGRHRLYLHARAQTQIGRAFSQDYIGFSRYDNIGLILPDDLSFIRLSSEAERVRGYRDFIAGDHVFFASGEYRIPLLPSLNTTILRFLRFRTTTIALFADAGAVLDPYSFSNYESSHYRLGVGGEIKNELLIGPLRFVHSIGVAQKYKELFGTGLDVYYRVRAGVPF